MRTWIEGFAFGVWVTLFVLRFVMMRDGLAGTAGISFVACILSIGSATERFVSSVVRQR